MSDLTASAPASLPVPREKNYRGAVKRFNTWAKGRPVTEETVRAFFTEHTGKAAASTLMLYKAAIKQGVLAAVPTHDTRALAALRELFRSIKVPKPESKLKNSDVFTPAEIKNIIRHAPMKTGAFIRALYDTGARVSELLSVRLADCKLHGLQGRAVLMRITGKGGRERELTIDWTLWKRIKGLCGGKTYLFEREDGRPWDRRLVWDHINKACMEALGRRAHPHQMRHSRVTHLLASGVPLGAVSRFAGHAQRTTTLAYYDHTEISANQILKTRLH